MSKKKEYDINKGLADESKVQEELEGLLLHDDTNLEETEDKAEAIEAIKKFTDEEDGIGEFSLKSILGGDILQSKFVVKQIMWFLFVAFLMIVYTGNRYSSQQDIIKIDELRGELQDVKYNVLTQSSELMNLSRQSNVERVLKTTPDSLLHTPVLPPYLIRTND